MHLDLDTFLTVTYCIVADLYRQTYAACKPKRRGKRPELSDEEVLTLMIVSQWQNDRSQRAFVRYAAAHWRSYFPRLLSQSQFNRRSRDLCGVLSALGPQIGLVLTAQLSAPAYEVLDGIAVPLMRRCRGGRHRCFANEAAFGRGGSDRDWYYGVKLLLCVNAQGLVTGFTLGPANTEERWLGDAFLCWRRFPLATPPTAVELAEVLSYRKPTEGLRVGVTGPLGLSSGVGAATAPVYVADLGYAGQEWQAHWQADYGAHVLTERDVQGWTHQAAWQRQLHALRQVVEQVNQHLTSSLGLLFPKARTRWGLLTRLAAKVAAHNLMRYLNHLCDRPVWATFSPFA